MSEKPGVCFNNCTEDNRRECQKDHEKRVKCDKAREAFDLPGFRGLVFP